MTISNSTKAKERDMINIFAKAGLAALIAFSAIPVTSAAAAGPEFDFGIYIGGPDHGPRYDRRRDDWRDHREFRRPRACAPGHAVEKARWNGLRRARIYNITPRRVVVAGFRHGDFDRMVFANVRGCPVIRY